jgi:exopolysaccharide production protein ExoQ
MKIIDLKRTAPIMIILMFVFFAPLGQSLINNSDVTGVNSQPVALFYSFGRLGVSLLCVLAIACTPAAGPALRSIAPILPFAGVAALSMAWTQDINSTWRQALDLAVLPFWMAAVVQWVGIQGLLRVSGAVAASVILLSLVLALAPPHIGVHQASDVMESIHAGKWRGIFVNKNAFGEFCVIALMLFLGQGRDAALPWKLFWRAMQIMALICLLMTKSANSLLGASVGLGVYALLTFRPTSRPVPLLIAAALAAIVAPALSLQMTDVARLVGRDPTFTGRTEIWDFVARLINEHLWLGHGYGTTDTVMGPMAQASLFTSAGSTHSGYLGLMFELGVVGAATFCFAVLVLVTRAYRATLVMQAGERQGVIVYIALVAASLVMAIGESSPFKLVGDGGTSFWLGMVVFGQVKAARMAARAMPGQGPGTQPATVWGLAGNRRAQPVAAPPVAGWTPRG